MKNKRILIIGGTGALGKTLIKKYHQDNTIMIFSRDEHKHVDLLKVYPNIKSYLGDIRDKESTTNSFSKFKPDIVLHEHAGGTGSKILWNFCKRHNCKYYFFKGLYFSTD